MGRRTVRGLLVEHGENRRELSNYLSVAVTALREVLTQVAHERAQLIDGAQERRDQVFARGRPLEPT